MTPAAKVTAEASSTSRRRWTALGALTLARTAMGLQFQSVGALSPLLMERLAIGNAEIGVLIGLFSLPGVVLALPGGMLGQRFGERRLVVAALLLMTAGSALIGEATVFSTAVAGRILTAAGAVLLNVLGTKLVTDWFSGRELVWAMAIFINAWPFGNGLALVTLPAVASLWTLGAAFHAAAAAAAVGAAVMAFVSPVLRSGDAHPKTTASTRLSRRVAGLVTLAAVPWMLYNVGYAVMLGFVPDALVRGGLSVEGAGAWLGLAMILFVGSVQAGGAAARWLTHPDRLVTLGLLPYALALGLLPYVPPGPPLTVIGILAGLPAAVLIAAPAAVLTSGNRGRGMGLFYTWYYAGMTLLPGVAGWLQDVVGRAAAIEFAAACILMTLVSSRVFTAWRGALVLDRPGR